MILLQNHLYYPDIEIAEALYYIQKHMDALERERQQLKELNHG
ncbi:MAG: hypothetical protein PHC50_04340 [Candidatus Cloacimonetes bacterium]|nr:hypothetical protein [Candidatus Cloacimonadota bacterium]